MCRCAKHNANSVIKIDFPIANRLRINKLAMEAPYTMPPQSMSAATSGVEHEQGAYAKA